MKKQILVAAVAASLVAAVCLMTAAPANAAGRATVDVSFSPDGGAETLVLRTIDRARQSVRVMAYTFTSPAVVRALIQAKRRGVDVQVSVDYRSNADEDRSGRARAALGALTYAGVPVRTIRTFPIQHSKYLLVDGTWLETGSYNYTQQAARANSENAVVISGDDEVIRKFVANWEQVTALGEPYRAQ
ncbi:phospholipase D family protein (plasmid) [Paraburkholderia sp. D15]|uniref:phospholipase D family nuclease n=1 Tax=Paraburkholderia sp. D15 TaxID=2880218 RepID=UPI002479CEAF|nr:phospholipase D family protein [Paraburkholderia sp. D15]WGS55049.1 phospholipase D family protein [Paraburkholderia sp. D15]